MQLTQATVGRILLFIGLVVATVVADIAPHPLRFPIVMLGVALGYFGGCATYDPLLRR
jgi:hypothetical protein